MSQLGVLVSILCFFLAYSCAQAWDFSLNFGDRSYNKDEFPWLVTVVSSCGTFVSGGSLISNHVVLTAWVPSEDSNVSELKVQIGEWNFDGETPVKPMEVRIKSIVRHPNFNKTSGAYNAALLFLTKTIEFNSKVHSINLATQTSLRTLDLNSCIVKGLTMKTLPLALVQTATCQPELQRWLGASFQLDGSLMCASGGIGRNVCDEDGYPLVCPLARNPALFQQVGIVNWHINCGHNAIPDVYTSVAKLRDWISQQIILNPYVHDPANQDIKETECRDAFFESYE